MISCVIQHQETSHRSETEILLLGLGQNNSNGFKVQVTGIQDRRILKFSLYLHISTFFRILQLQFD
jgi:hypothetical protein